MSLKSELTESVKSAMRAKDKPRLGTLRLVTAAIKQREVDERIELDDTAVIAVLEKMRKQRQDALGQFRAAGRDDLADQEAFEIGILEEFLPTPLGDAEIDALIVAAVTETGAASMREMGKVMGLLKPKLQGRADLGAVSAKVKARLSASG